MILSLLSMTNLLIPKLTKFRQLGSDDAPFAVYDQPAHPDDVNNDDDDLLRLIDLQRFTGHETKRKEF